MRPAKRRSLGHDLHWITESLSKTAEDGDGNVGKTIRQKARQKAYVNI